jgi:hypothetical protein
LSPFARHPAIFLSFQHKIHRALKDRWNLLSDKEKHIWKEWEKWDERRHAQEVAIHNRAETKKRDSQDGESDVHVPKKKKRLITDLSLNVA